MHLMIQSWRWYGPNDPVRLSDIRQAGATDIVHALHHIPNGEVWTVEEILSRQQMIADAGLCWSVVESVPVHEHIKTQTGDFQRYIDNYKQSIRNLAKCGIRTVCYNFMPILDWTRSDLAYDLGDGSTCLGYNEYEVAAFDMFALKRPGAEKDFDAKTRARAKRLWTKYTPAQKKRVEKSILTGLPGTVDDLTPKEFLRQLKSYEGIGDKELRANMYAFLNEITPVLEEYNIDGFRFDLTKGFTQKTRIFYAENYLLGEFLYRN